MKKATKIIIGILALFGVLGLIAGGLLFYFITQVDYKYTGEELFTAVNKHRTSVGAPTLQLEPALCDNLVERWLAITQPNNGHKGFEEWLKSEGIKTDANDNSRYGLVGEMYVTESTPQRAIAWWLSSPGHKSTLEMKEMVFGCAYASDGTGVVIMASPGETQGANL